MISFIIYGNVGSDVSQVYFWHENKKNSYVNFMNNQSRTRWAFHGMRKGYAFVSTERHSQIHPETQKANESKNDGKKDMCRFLSRGNDKGTQRCKYEYLA